MKNFTKPVVSFRETWDSLGMNPTVVSYSRSAITGAYDYLASVNYTHNGDHKTPYSQEYEHGYDSYVHGRQLTHYKGAFHEILRVGQLRNDVPTPTFSYGFDSEPYNDALGQAYAKLRGELDLSIDAFQIRQTVGLVKTFLAVKRSINTIDEAAKTVRKLRRKGLSPNAFGDAWLEYVYGLKPTVSDIYDTFHTCFLTPDLEFYKVRTKAKRQRVYDYTVSPGTYGTGFRDVFSYLASDRCMFEFSVRIKHTVNTQLAGFTSLNPVSIAWELFPYSFVADWFYNIGGYLRSLENALLYQSDYFRGYVTRTKLIFGNTYCRGFYDDASQWTYLDASGSSRYAHKLRSTFASAPFPYPPRLKVDLGSSRLLSGASLLGQLLR